MKRKNTKLLFFGIYNAISVFPALFFAWNVIAPLMVMLWWFYPSFAFAVFCLCIIFLSPFLCIKGIVLGIRGRKKGCGYALACFILSMIGLLLFAVVTGFLWYRITHAPFF